MTTKIYKIGTRSSPLALAQAEIVKKQLTVAHNLSEDCIKIIPMSTKGDLILDKPLMEIGGKGLFTEEIEQALREKQIDLAVHSTKDLPPVDPSGLSCEIFLKRANRADSFISHKASCLLELPYGATIGTSSPRRKSLALNYRPDLKVVPFRGNVNSRLAKLERGEVDATFLAYAGLERLNITNFSTDLMDCHFFPPAPSQGAIAVQTRENDSEILPLLQSIKDINTTYEITCERAFTKQLGGSCRTAIAALSKVSGNELAFMGVVLSLDGTKRYSSYMVGSLHDAENIGREVAMKLQKEIGVDFFVSRQ